MDIAWTSIKYSKPLFCMSAALFDGDWLTCPGPPTMSGWRHPSPTECGSLG